MTRATPPDTLIPDSVPAALREDMTRTARRHLPRGGWDPDEDPVWDRGLALGRACALRALRYGYPAWRFEIVRARLVVERAVTPVNPG